MAEPDWALWQSILQQLQTDISGMKSDMSELRQDMQEVKSDFRQFKRQLRYAVGSAGVAEHQSAEAEQATGVLKEQMREVLARLDELEKQR